MRRVASQRMTGAGNARRFVGRRSVVALLICCGLSVGGAATPTSALARVRTRSTIFRPFRSDGSPTIRVTRKRGYCWTGSLAANRLDAWRCLVGNQISDPCFSSDLNPDYVVCPNGLVSGGIEIHLTRGLPYKYADPGRPSMGALPWNIETLAGRHYAFITGGTRVADGQRLNYACVLRGCNGILWGGPRRHTEPWTILWSRDNATMLHQLTKIRQVWT